MSLLKIPKGSKIYDGDKFVATTVEDLYEQDMPMPHHFNPELPMGYSLDNFKAKFEGKLIYDHPNFV